ncbi:hypothetical protein MA16_Dca011844 [Dendrobium catenatum]|uniref:DUF4218 domain-containing protein n=1 Tax=Dendrobium catenatum TaxID=906689 RepID=A0A2I0XDD7_9ASPA|nr:hypothetical protein MA16_Dca011844 [Dendrobium catenatum]
MKPAKILRYFPLIPRLQRLFKTKKMAKEMIWHATQRNTDGMLRHPADGDAWKSMVTKWKKKSIFFYLSYWQYNILPHNLDVMHIEKNIFDNFISTLLDLEKSKDNLQARQDLVQIGVKPELHPHVLSDGSYVLPPALFTMSKKDKMMFCEVLKKMKLPKGYSSNISKGVNIKECKIIGLKSHDCHVLIEDIMPIALRSCAPSNEVLTIIVGISHFLKFICGKVINPIELDKKQKEIALTLCNMEKYFLPSFFTIMVHLLIHLVEEVRFGGPVHYRWMYPFER